MGRFIGLIVTAFLLYQGYQYAAPWIEERLEADGRSAFGSADDDEARCVAYARDAAHSLADSMRQFSQPPIDQQEWSSAFITFSSDVGAAESACRCPSVACDRAAEAVSELRDLSLSFDGVARGGSSSGITNPARQLESVYNLLAEAERLAGG
jgi:hypothetical protein